MAASNSAPSTLDILFSRDLGLVVPQRRLEIATINRNCTPQVVQYLSDRRPDLKVTRATLEAATRNSNQKETLKVTEVLLERNPEVEIPDSVSSSLFNWTRPSNSMGKRHYRVATMKKNRNRKADNSLSIDIPQEAAQNNSGMPCFPLCLRLLFSPPRIPQS
jgi:hypothetical protein